MAASHIAIYNDLRGPSNSLTMREAAANLAVGEASQLIARGAIGERLGLASARRRYSGSA